MLMGDDIERLYRERSGYFVGLVEWLVGGRVHAEEVVHDVFVQLVARPPTLRSGDALEAYVRRAVLNGGNSRLRRFVLERKHATTRVDEGVEDARPDHAVRTAVLALPIRQRQCVVLRFYEDLTVDQIGAVLGMCSGTVKSHLHRAMQTLGERLKAEVYP